MKLKVWKEKEKNLMKKSDMLTCENLVWKNTLLPLLQCTVFSTEQMHFLLKFRERERMKLAQIIMKMCKSKRIKGGKKGILFLKCNKDYG